MFHVRAGNDIALIIMGLSCVLPYTENTPLASVILQNFKVKNTPISSNFVIFFVLSLKKKIYIYMYIFKECNWYNFKSTLNE